VRGRKRRERQRERGLPVGAVGATIRITDLKWVLSFTILKEIKDFLFI
jgi:hypothetical protein